MGDTWGLFTMYTGVQDCHICPFVFNLTFSILCIEENDENPYRLSHTNTPESPFELWKIKPS